MKSPVFFRLFGKSPFRKLSKHADEVVKIMDVLKTFLDCAYDEEWESAEKYFQQILEIESEADQIKLALRRRLHGQWFMPLSASLLLEFVNAQDNIANEVKDIAGLMLARRMKLPDIVKRELIEMYQCGYDAACSLQRLVTLLPDLLEAGFRGPILKEVYSRADQIASWETEVDKLHFYVRHRLWQVEREHNALDMVFWYRLFLFMSRVSDWAERSSSRYLLMVTK